MAQASVEKLEYNGPPEKERVATEKAVGQYARAVSPEYQIMREERVKVSEREGNQSGSMERKGWTSQ